MRRIATGMFFLTATLMLLAPTRASAQSGLAGLVTDTTGAVMPGVTVEAASPALIEKVRAVVTDAQGRYNIIDLRPGAYTVTFTLPGFSTVKREGLELPANFTATVNAELKVGALEETVTVSGAAPVVDMSSATHTETMTRALMDELPSQRTMFGIGGTIPGVKIVTPDVGGQRMMQHSAGALSVHGLSGGDNAIQVDGMLINTQQSDGSVQMYPNDAMTEETSFQTSAVGAEVSAGGLRQNMIPRQGGNLFSGLAYAGGTAGSWINNSVPADLFKRGLTVPTSIQRIYDTNIGVGGPILRDKMWFYFSYQDRSSNDLVAGLFDEFTGQQAVLDQWIRNPTTRLTFQATPKNKLTAYYDRAIKQKGHDAGFGTEFPTASQRRDWRHGLYYIGQAKWTSTVSNQILFEAGHSQVFEDHAITCQPGITKARNTPEWFTSAVRRDTDLGTQTTACSGGQHNEYPRRFVESTSLAYITGSHNVKVGMQWSWGHEPQTRDENGDLEQQYKTGKPDNVLIAMSPVVDDVRVRADRGIYGQDTLTIKRLTLNLGIRFEHFNSELPAYQKPAGRFAPAHFFPERKNLPNWNDVTPRFGIVYDVAGDGKTAIKGGVNKYVLQYASGFARRYSPTQYTSNDQRNWNDCAYLAGQSTCDPALVGAAGYHDDIAQDNEIGPSSNQNFGVAVTRHPADDIKRGYTMEYSASVQRELVSGIGVTAGWYRRKWYNLEKTVNQLVALSDYAAFQTANPLTGEMITIYNLNRTKQGFVDQLDTTSTNDGRTYDGIELSSNARLRNGITVYGGWSTERTVQTVCEADVTNPNSFRYCDQTGTLYQDLGAISKIPFRWDAKLSGSFPLPMKMRTSMAFTSTAGTALNVNWSPAASVFPGAQRTQAVTVRLVPPGTKFLDRRNQLDIGLRRTFKFGKLQTIPGLDIFNSLNSKAVLSQNQSFGTSLDQPQTTLIGRMFRLSANFTW